jgi:hypothetical protein
MHIFGFCLNFIRQNSMSPQRSDYIIPALLLFFKSSVWLGV